MGWRQGARKAVGSHSPIICVTCQREFPDDFDGDKTLRVFVQYHRHPTASDWDGFGNEAKTITSYITAVADLMRYADQEIEDETYRTVFQLVGELSEEASRRLELSLDAMEIEWKREQEAKKAPMHERRGCRHGNTTSD